MTSNLRKYFFWRTISAIGDEMWVMSIPLVLAATFDTQNIGIVYSIGSLGTIIGFVFSSWFSMKFSDGFGAFITDIIQSVVFFTLSLALFFKVQMTEVQWYVIFFILNFMTAVWFALTESLVSRLNVDNTNLVHKWNFLSGSLGPIFGPLLGSGVVAIGILFILPFLNAISFLGQAFQLKNISDNKTRTKTLSEAHNTNWLTVLKNGTILIFKNTKMLGLTAIPVCVKVGLVGIIPFIAIKLAKIGISPFLIGIVMVGFPIGSFLGSLAYGNKKIKKIFLTFEESVFLIVFGVIILVFLYLMKNPNIWFLMTTLFLCGFTAAQYTIHLRGIRQKFVPDHLLSAVIASQSLLVRLATPISGILFGSIILQYPFIGFLIYVILISMALFGLYELSSVKESY